jgi:DNA repair protein RecO (recombination protein O)
MIAPTRGIVLRSVKYGETSLITSIFTELYGVQSYLIQGVRSSNSKTRKAGLLQPSMLLNIEVDNKPNRNLQRLREFHPAYIYSTVHEEIIKNSVALFSTELLLRLLPQEASLPELFLFAFDYYTELDKTEMMNTGNFPLYFIIQCSRFMGYNIQGAYTPDTPFLNLEDGAYTSYPPTGSYSITEEDGKYLSGLLHAKSYGDVYKIEMNANLRYKLLDWYIQFLHRHTQHLGAIKSLPVLKAVLH